MGSPSGRPAKSPSDRRSRLVQVRFTPAEYERLAERAQALHETPGGFARRMALSRSLPRPVPTINREQWAALARLGGNLNQWMQAINAGSVPAGDRPAVEALRALLAEVRDGLIGR